MKRLFIFTMLFPPLALVVFNAPDMIAHLDFKLMDSTTFELSYVIAVIPAWLVAAVDWWQNRVWVTAIAGAALGYAAAFAVGFPFIDPFASLMVGFVFGIPATVCSWLSSVNLGKATCVSDAHWVSASGNRRRLDGWDAVGLLPLVTVSCDWACPRNARQGPATCAWCSGRLSPRGRGQAVRDAS